jgi:hypothetical protein
MCVYANSKLFSYFVVQLCWAFLHTWYSLN